MKHGTQHGQTLVIFTIVCAFLLLGTMALVGNTQVLLVNSDRADAAALLAAQAGASAIDTHQALYDNNTIALDPQEAQQRCQAAGDAQPLVVSTNCPPPVGNTVTATVTMRVQLPLPLWADFETVTATHSARPAYGGATGGF
jgi:hypothetical protein